MADRHRILVVEDAAALRRLLTYQLQGLGFTVTTASNGNEAVALYQRDGLPYLSIPDVLMPRLDGLAVTRALRQHEVVPILLISAFRSCGQADRTLSLVDHYLPKPFTLAHLLAQVERQLAAP